MKLNLRNVRTETRSGSLPRMQHPEIQKYGNSLNSQLSVTKFSTDLCYFATEFNFKCLASLNPMYLFHLKIQIFIAACYYIHNNLNLPNAKNAIVFLQLLVTNVSISVVFLCTTVAVRYKWELCQYYIYSVCDSMVPTLVGTDDINQVRQWAVVSSQNSSVLTVI